VPIRTPWTEAELRRLAKLHNVFADAGTRSEVRDAFRLKIEQMLRAHGSDTRVDATNADLHDLLKQAREALEREDRDRAARNAGAAPPPPPGAPPSPPGSAPQSDEALFNYICEIFERFMYFRVPEYRPAIAAWVMHTYKFRSR
jgi:hypothetical protein